jgi:hypothetical protein
MKCVDLIYQNPFCYWIMFSPSVEMREKMLVH